MRNQTTQFLIDVRQFINTTYSLEEFQTLCFDLQIDYENLNGEIKWAKIQDLLILIAKEERLPSLLSILHQERPHIEWPTIPINFKLPEHILSYSKPVHGDLFDVQIVGTTLYMALELAVTFDSSVNKESIAYFVQHDLASVLSLIDNGKLTKAIQILETLKIENWSNKTILMSAIKELQDGAKLAITQAKWTAPIAFVSDLYTIKKPTLLRKANFKCAYFALISAALCALLLNSLDSFSTNLDSAEKCIQPYLSTLLALNRIQNPTHYASGHTSPNRLRKKRKLRKASETPLNREAQSMSRLIERLRKLYL